MFPLVLTSCKPGLDHRAWLNGYTGDVIILNNVKQGSSNINRGFIIELQSRNKILVFLAKILVIGRPRNNIAN